jgi:aspartate aminotransferase-like enzyme
VREKLAQVTCVPDDVLILAGSGSASFEAGLLACVPKGATVIGINAGKFGERWVKLARTFGYTVVELTLPWGSVAKPAELEALLRKHPDAQAVMTTHSETSTGALHDIQALAAAVRNVTPEALFLVDCVTSHTVSEIRPLEWGLDGVFSGSQKGFMLPPGLAFAWLSERAWDRRDTLNPSFYLDLRKELQSQRLGQTAYTPAVNLIVALDVALELLLTEGIEQVWARRKRQNDALLAAATKLGCAPFAERMSPAVAALKAPKGVSAPDIVKGLASYGLRIAGGQDHAKPVLFRPSVMGYCDTFDVITLVSALEYVLSDLGYPVHFGEGVATAMTHLRHTA